MTERLYYHDSYLRAFTATAVEVREAGMTVYLDRTAFYPTSGGQPFDTGSIAGVPVLEVVDEEERIAHKLAAPVSSGPVECAIDWERRFDHMQQHTGQHLLSAVFEARFGLRTISFHLGQDSATIDLEGGGVDSRIVEETEREDNAIVWENRPVGVAFEEAAQAEGLRKASERAGTLRIVTIADLDRSACGGTHVRATGEIGVILIRKLEKIRQSTRVEFLCGGRAARRARADFAALSRAAQLFSAPLDDVPELVAAQLEAAKASEKARRKLEADLAGHQGRELYEQTPPGPDGMRRRVHAGPGVSLESLRVIAQSFTAKPRAVFVAATESPAAVLFAVSSDAGIDAAKTLQPLLAAAGGRGGGTARMAQGSVPDAAQVQQLLERLAVVS